MGANLKNDWQDYRGDNWDAAAINAHANAINASVSHVRLNVTTTLTLPFVQNTDYTVLLKTGANATLPPAAQNTSRYFIKNMLGVDEVVNIGAGDNVDGSTGTITLPPYAAVTLISDGTNTWSVF